MNGSHRHHTGLARTDCAAQAGMCKTAGGLAQLLVRRGAPFNVEQSVEPLQNNHSGIPNGIAFVIANILISPSARELMAVDPRATHRSKPEYFHRLIADTVHTQRVIQVARDGIDTVATV